VVRNSKLSSNISLEISFLPILPEACKERSKIKVISFVLLIIRMCTKSSSCLHRASVVSKHFLLFQLMHTIIKIIECLKHAAITLTVSIPTSTDKPYLVVSAKHRTAP